MVEGMQSGMAEGSGLWLSSVRKQKDKCCSWACFLSLLLFILSRTIACGRVPPTLRGTLSSDRVYRHARWFYSQSTGKWRLAIVSALHAFPKARSSTEDFGLPSEPTTKEFFFPCPKSCSVLGKILHRRSDLCPFPFPLFHYATCLLWLHLWSLASSSLEEQAGWVMLPSWNPKVKGLY